MPRRVARLKGSSRGTGGRKATKYHGGTAGFWKGFHQSPPTATGIAPLIARAQRADPGFRLPSWGAATADEDAIGQADNSTEGNAEQLTTSGVPGAQKGRGRKLSVSPMADWDSLSAYAGDAPPQSWLISNAIPRAVAGIVASAGDLGKSYLCLELCLRVTRGPLSGTCLEPPILGGLIASHGAAVFVTAEDSRGLGAPPDTRS